jgi:uncharacterized protein
MDSSSQVSSVGRLRTIAPCYRWIILFCLSLAIVMVFSEFGVPAAMLLGSMLGAIILAVNGGELNISHRPFAIAQGVIGCMIAKTLSTTVTGSSSSYWPLFLFGVLSVVVAGYLLSWVMTRLKVLPGTTTVWGLSPGAASAMTVLAESYGADAQLVAFMQYLRVVMVVVFVTIIAHFFGVGVSHHTQTQSWFSEIAWLPFIQTLLLVVAGPLVAYFMNIRGGALLVPLVLGIVFEYAGLITIELPRWFLAIAYALIGWRIGLRFSRPLLAHAAKVFPHVFLCTLALIAACGLIAVVLVFAAGIDPLTAYLATSPGGADSVAIVAASSKVDQPFVMTMQMARLLVVLLVGPSIAKWMARRSDAVSIKKDGNA